MSTEEFSSPLFLSLPNHFPVISAAEFQSLVDYLSSRIRMAIRVYLEGEDNRDSSSNGLFMKNIRAELELCGGSVAMACLKYEGLVRVPDCYKKAMLVVLNNGTLFRDHWLSAIAGGGKDVADGYLDRYIHSWWLSFPNDMQPLTTFMHGYNTWKQQQLKTSRALSPLPSPSQPLALLSLDRLRAGRVIAGHLQTLITEQVKVRMGNIKALEAKIVHVGSELKYIRGKRLEDLGNGQMERFKRSRQ